MTTKHTLADHSKAIGQAGQTAADKFDELPTFIATQENELADASIDIDSRILAEMKLEAAQRIQRENSHVRIEDLIRRAKDDYLKAHAVEILPLLQSSLADLEKSKAGFLKVIGQKASAITAAMFATDSPEESDQLLAQRQQAEREAEEKLIDIAAAKQAINSFRADPGFVTFDAAMARLSEVSFAVKN